MYTERKKCIFCNSNKLSEFFQEKFTIPLGSYNVEEPKNKYEYMPLNIVSCDECLTFQLKYLGDLSEIYNVNHAYSYGSILSENNKNFTLLIKDTIPNIKGIVEIGGGSGILSDVILNNIDTEYTIIDPYYFGNYDKKIIINDYVENVDFDIINSNIVVMSHVFEHFYEPLKVIEKISDNKKIEYICLNFPDLETYVKKGTNHVLNPEHTYYVNNSFIIAIFQKYGFDILKKEDYRDHSVHFIFKKSDNIENKLILYNTYADKYIKIYYDNIYKTIEKINTEISLNENRLNYIWPCSMHTIYLFTFGLNHKLFNNILDNSPSKINKYLYGYDLLCKSFKEVQSDTNDQITIFLIGGCFNKELEMNNTNNIKYIVI